MGQYRKRAVRVGGKEYNNIYIFSLNEKVKLPGERVTTKTAYKRKVQVEFVLEPLNSRSRFASEDTSKLWTEEFTCRLGCVFIESLY